MAPSTTPGRSPKPCHIITNNYTHPVNSRLKLLLNITEILLLSTKRRIKRALNKSQGQPKEFSEKNAVQKINIQQRLERIKSYMA